jgi:hypothetical protein
MGKVIKTIVKKEQLNIDDEIKVLVTMVNQLIKE